MEPSVSGSFPSHTDGPGKITQEEQSSIPMSNTPSAVSPEQRNATQTVGTEQILNMDGLVVDDSTRGKGGVEKIPKEHEPSVQIDKVFDDSRDGPKPEPNGPSHPSRMKGETRRLQTATQGLGCKMRRFSLYETASQFWLIGSDITDQNLRILRIEKSSEPGQLKLQDDEKVYSKKEMNRLLLSLDDAGKGSGGGGLKLKCNVWGLLGFIKFTGEYYMLVITKGSRVAMLGGHYIYKIDSTELISLMSTSSSRHKSERHPDESRFVNILGNVDLSRSFYFSYSYDITSTLQRNIQHARGGSKQGDSGNKKRCFNQMFVWNHNLLQPASGILSNIFDWFCPIIHGFVDQATISIYGRTAYVTVIARRSRYFAGARFLKRGVNDLGYVANDVETEQVVSDMLTTSFHAPGPRPFTNPNYTAYVQHRGSIPLFWTQDNAGVAPKPAIHLDLVDPFFSAAALHFDNLFERYGTPIYILNLVKSRERTPRESILLKEYERALEYLNQFLPAENKIMYRAFDMSRASKSRDQDVIGTLDTIADNIFRMTDFFHNGDNLDSNLRLQNGVARTNCIDCLDRTNAAQFVIGKLALGHQLHALGITSSISIDYDTDAVNLFTHMWHDHGDTIAIQYGGSHLVNTMETYRKINQWTSHSRDMVESFKRYYNNSFLDSERQQAYNLFLGNYIFAQGQPMLWELSTDYYLHHLNPRLWSAKARRSYIQWFNPNNLEPQTMPSSFELTQNGHDAEPGETDDYWYEYYRPTALSSFQKMFAFRMNSTLKFIPFKTGPEHRHDLSPFKVRSRAEYEHAEKEKEGPRKEVTILETPEAESETRHSPVPMTPHDMESSVPTTARSEPTPLASHGIIKDAPQGRDGIIEPHVKTPKDKSAITQWTLNQFVVNSLNPSVQNSELEQYGRYISHPLNIPLVITDATPPNPNADLLKFVNSVSAEAQEVYQPANEDLAEFGDFLHVDDEPLTVSEADAPKKRYKAYRQWLKGKSLFKQSYIDPVYA